MILSRCVAVFSMFALCESPVFAADAASMKNACQVRAAGHFGVSEGAVEVKYEGQRTDKTHAVNGSAEVNGNTETFQCSFEPSGKRITNFVVNAKPVKEKSQRPKNQSPAPQVVSDEEPEGLKRARAGRFDSRGEVPCSTALGQPTRPCKFGAVRSSNGMVYVVITRADGTKRTIFFRRGEPTSSDLDTPGVKFTYEKEADLYMIRVGDERYEIPEAVITGG